MKVFTWKIPENLPKKLLELSGFSKVTGYKVNIQNYCIFISTSSEQLEIKILKNPNRILKSRYLKWYFIEGESRFNTMNNSIATKRNPLHNVNELLNEAADLMGKSAGAVFISSGLG